MITEWLLYVIGTLILTTCGGVFAYVTKTKVDKEVCVVKETAVEKRLDEDTKRLDDGDDKFDQIMHELCEQAVVLGKQQTCIENTDKTVTKIAEKLNVVV